jgi:hypothetical protein
MEPTRLEDSMARLARVLSAAVIVGAGVALAPASVRAQGTAEPTVTRIARLSTSTITGVVRDERGAPVPGARVTVIGATMAMALLREPRPRAPARELARRKAHLVDPAAARI